MCWAEHFQEVGWEQGPDCCKQDSFALQTWTHVLLPTVSSNNVSAACIPCFSRDSSRNSLEVPFSGLQIESTTYKEHEDEGRTNRAAASSTEFLSVPQARLSLQTLDSKSQLHRDQLGSLPPGSPGHTEGLCVDTQAWQDGMEAVGSALVAHLPREAPQRQPEINNYKSISAEAASVCTSAALCTTAQPPGVWPHRGGHTKKSLLPGMTGGLSWSSRKLQEPDSPLQKHRFKVSPFTFYQDKEPSF